MGKRKTTSSRKRDLSKGDAVVTFFEKRLSHVKGRWAGQPFVLRDWQADGIVRPLFGTLRRDGKRQFRTAYIEVPRKNGKSALGAGFALWLLLGDGEKGAEVYSAAADRDQASIVFNMAAQMVRQDAKLSARCRIIDSQKRIIDTKSGGVYRAVSAEAYTKHGFSASGIIFDELHAQPNRELWDVLTTSTGARDQPAVIAITTAGFDKYSICWEQHEYAERVLSGVVEDPSFFAFIRGAPEDADWRDEGVWRAANPALGDFRSLDEMRALARRAEETPALQNTFRRLYLNQWTAQETRWLPLELWDASAGQVDVEALKGRACIGGLDLSATTDLTAFVLVFPPDGDDDTYTVLPYAWLPEDRVAEAVRRDRVPYNVWIDQGHLETTPGSVVDDAFILRRIAELGEVFHIREVVFDRWGARRIQSELAGLGFNVVEFGQGYASMSGPTKALLQLVMERRVRHGGHPVLRWNMDCLTVQQDAAENVKPVKPERHRDSKRIDLAVALIMALGRATVTTPAPPPSVYEERGLITL